MREALETVKLTLREQTAWFEAEAAAFEALYSGLLTGRRPQMLDVLTITPRLRIRCSRHRWIILNTVRTLRL
mgnify:CR=1 FL=1